MLAQFAMVPARVRANNLLDIFSDQESSEEESLEAHQRDPRAFESRSASSERGPQVPRVGQPLCNQLKRKAIKNYAAAEFIYRDRERQPHRVQLEGVEKILFWYDLGDMEAVRNE